MRCECFSERLKEWILLSSSTLRKVNGLVVCVCLVAFAAIVAAHMVPETSTRAWLDNLHWTIGYVGAAAFAWIRCIHPGPEYKRAIAFLAVGLSISALGQIVWDIEFGTKWQTFSGLAGVFFAVGGLVAVLGICCELYRIVPKSLHGMASIDLAGLAVGQFAVLLTLVLPHSRSLSVAGIAKLTSSPLVIIIGASCTVLFAVHGRAKAHWSWILSGLGLAVSSLTWLQEQAHGLQPGGTLNAWFTVTVLAYGIAAVYWRLEPNPLGNTEQRNRISLFLPLAAVSLAAFAHLLAFTTGQLTAPERWVITALFFVVILLGLMRQTLLVAALNESQTSLLLAQKGSNDGLWDWRIRSGSMTYSDRFCEMLGYEPGEYPARFEALLDDVHPDDALAVSQLVERQLTDSEPFHAECRIRTKSGTYRWFLIRGQAELSANGSAHRMTGVIGDVTERLEAQAALKESEARFKQIIDASPLGIFLFDLVEGDQLRLIDANPASARISAIDVSSILGMPLEQAFPAVSTHEIAEALKRAAREGVPYSNAEYLYANDWEFGVFEVHAVQTAPGRVAVLFTDISERKAAEREIAHLNEVLEERIEARTAQLRATNDELEAFAYSVSHDLRAPLRGLDGFALFLDERLQEIGLEDERRYTARLRSAAKRMGEIIDSLLMLSRVTRGQLRLKEVDLTRLFREVGEEALLVLPERKVEWIFHPTEPVLADLSLMRTLADNLVRNALKFTQGRSLAVIEFGETKRTERTREFYIRDNGVGFDPRYAERMFRPFQRLHAEHQFEGTGIGLATVSRIVARHGGSVRAKGEIDAGATLYFELPMQPEGQAVP